MSSVKMGIVDTFMTLDATGRSGKLVNGNGWCQGCLLLVGMDALRKENHSQCNDKNGKKGTKVWCKYFHKKEGVNQYYQVKSIKYKHQKLR
jgi:hypothetical protein